MPLDFSLPHWTPPLSSWHCFLPYQYSKTITWMGSFTDSGGLITWVTSAHLVTLSVWKWPGTMRSQGEYVRGRPVCGQYFIHSPSRTYSWVTTPCLLLLVHLIWNKPCMGEKSYLIVPPAGVLGKGSSCKMPQGSWLTASQQCLSGFRTRETRAQRRESDEHSVLVGSCEGPLSSSVFKL